MRPVSHLTTEQREKVLAAGNFVEPLGEGETAVEGLDLDAIEKWLETSGSSGLGGRVGALAYYVHQLVAALRQAQQQATIDGERLAYQEGDIADLRQQLHSIGESFAAGEFVGRASNT